MAMPDADAHAHGDGDTPLPPPPPSPSSPSSQTSERAPGDGPAAACTPDPAPPPPPASRRGAAIRLGFGLAALAGALLLAWVVALPEIPLCAFKSVTGRPCPGCGMTRSIVSLFRGDIVASLRFHPLGIILAGALLAGIGGAIAGVSRRRDRAWEWFDRKGAHAAIVFAAALIVLWLLRAFVFTSWSPDPVGPPGLPWYVK